MTPWHLPDLRDDAERVIRKNFPTAATSPAPSRTTTAGLVETDAPEKPAAMDEAVRLAPPNGRMFPMHRLAETFPARRLAGSRRPIRHAGLRGLHRAQLRGHADGRWYFQNGPQRVFVEPRLHPTILHLAATDRLQTHTGQPVNAVSGARFDEEGSLLLQSEHGIALLDDRDLAALCAYLEGDLEDSLRRTDARIGPATEFPSDESVRPTSPPASVRWRAHLNSLAQGGQSARPPPTITPTVGILEADDIVLAEVAPLTEPQ